MKKQYIWLIVVVCVIVIVGCLRQVDNDQYRPGDIDLLRNSLLWKDLTSSSRDSIHRAIIYLSKSQNTDARLSHQKSNDKIEVFSCQSESLEDLKARSKELQRRLLGQSHKEIVDLVNLYAGYVQTYSPYYPD